jgi:hypothetical protein
VRVPFSKRRANMSTFARQSRQICTTKAECVCERERRGYEPVTFCFRDDRSRACNLLSHPLSPTRVGEVWPGRCGRARRPHAARRLRVGRGSEALDGPASGGKGSQGGPYKYYNTYTPRGKAGKWSRKRLVSQGGPFVGLIRAHHSQTPGRARPGHTQP